MAFDAQPASVAIEPGPPSRTRLSIKTLANLLALAGLLLLVAVPVSIPIIMLDDQELKREYWRFQTMPADDAAVLEWLETAGMDAPAASRPGGLLRLEYIGKKKSGPADPPWRELGYSGPYLQRVANSMPPRTATFFVGFSTLIVLFYATRLRRRSARQGIPITLLPTGNMTRSVRIALAVAGVSLAMGFLNAWAATRLLGEHILDDAPGNWFFHVDSLWLALLTVVAAAICAPLAEEMLFRGVFLARFQAAGFPLYGILFTSMLFAVVHGFWPLIPFYLCIGVLACFAYLKTGTLFAPMLAHGLVNGFACAISFAS
jgi:membrane protease YdiL (CAAX protease family)